MSRGWSLAGEYSNLTHPMQNPATNNDAKMNTERILIAGCGDLGCALGKELAAEGHRVFGLRRNAARIPAPLEPVAADLCDAESLAAALPSPIDRVYFIVTPDRRDEGGYRRAFVEGLINLRESLLTHSATPRKLIFVSSTAVYGQSGGEWIDEESATEPTRFTGEWLLKGEAEALAGPWAGTVVRFGGIYGGGRDYVLRKVEAGEPCDPEHYTNRIHHRDCVGILRHLGRPEVADGVYIGVDDDPAPQCAVMDYVAELLGCAPPPRRPGGGGWSRAGSKRCSNQRLKATGYRLLYASFREGYAEIVRTLRS